MSKAKKLIKQLNSASAKLSSENKKTFDDIVVYIRLSNIKTKDAEDFLQQLLDSFLNAEEQVVNIETVLGTSDIKAYCDEIVNTYKASYNILSRSSEFIMYTGMFFTMLTAINFITQNLVLIIKSGIHSFTFTLDYNLGMLVQLLFIILAVYLIMLSVKKSCFKIEQKVNKIKDFLILWLVCIAVFGIITFSYILLKNFMLFKLNIFILILIGLVLYFLGQYFSEK